MDFLDFRILKKKFRLLGTFTEIFTIFRLLVRNFRLLAFRFPYTEFPDSVTEFRLLGTALFFTIFKTIFFKVELNFHFNNLLITLIVFLKERI